MILVGFFCVLGAIGLLVTGLVQADPDLVWASIGASAVGGLAVVAAAVQRGRVLQRGEPASRVVPEPTAPAGARIGPSEPIPAQRPKSADPDAPAGESRGDDPDRSDELPDDDVEHADAVVDDVVIAVMTDDVDVDVDPADWTDDDVADDAWLEGELTDVGETVDPDTGDPVDEPPEEDVDVADLLTVIDLTEEVLVVDLRPRYHLAPCEHLDGREAIPIPVNEAREDGFTPCSLCRPDAVLAASARQVRSAED